MKYFTNFPTIYYNGQKTKNIVLKYQFFQNILNDYTAFYPFVVTNNLSPQDVAEQYYGSKEWDWLVYMANDIYDPYLQWPLTNREFQNFIEEKYGSYEVASTTILYYKYNLNSDPTDPFRLYNTNYSMPITTYSFLSSEEKSLWTPVYAYDHEFEKNEQKRTIRLFDNELINKLAQEISNIF